MVVNEIIGMVMIFLIIFFTVIIFDIIEEITTVENKDQSEEKGNNISPSPEEDYFFMASMFQDMGNDL